MSKEDFKTFVRDNPNLVNHVKNNEMTWQKFYEMYDIYGPSNEIWNKYLKTTSKLSSNITIKELINMAKDFDLSAVQKGLGSLEKVVGVIKEIAVKNSGTTSSTSSYEPRPMYKYFED